jgi:hypothetical protein
MVEPEGKRPFRRKSLRLDDYIKMEFGETELYLLDSSAP